MTKNINIVIDNHITTHGSYSTDMATQQTTLTVTTLAAKTHNELLRRLQENNFNAIELRMRNGDAVKLEVYINPENDRVLENAEWFEVVNPWGIRIESENLIDIAVGLCDYEQLIEHHNDSVQKLIDFYETNIKHHTREELQIGDAIVTEAFDTQLRLFSTNAIRLFCKKYNLTKDQYATCITLSHNWNFYSDWYKTVHNVRPKF